MVGWSLLLGAALEAALDLLVEVGFGDEARALKERLTKRTERARQAAFDRAVAQAIYKADAERLRPLLDHESFRKSVVAGLLDVERGFHPHAPLHEWERRLPSAYVPGLRRFFRTLESQLLVDETWGPLLERYQTLRFRKDVLEALEARRLDAPLLPLVSDESPQVRLDEQVQKAKYYTELNASTLFHHRTITSLHVLFSLCEMDLVFPCRDALRNLLQPDSLRQYLRDMASDANSISPDSSQTSKKYEEIFDKARQLAHPNEDKVTVLHVLQAIASSNSTSISNYLRHIQVSWEQFSRTCQIQRGQVASPF